MRYRNIRKEGLKMETQNQKEPLYDLSALKAKEVVKTNPVMGLLLAIIFGLIGAGIWALVAKTTGYNVGYIAILVGFLVSQGFVIAGRGHQMIWGVVAAAVAIVSMLVGKVLTIVLVLSSEYGMTITEVITALDFELTKEILIETFQVYDLVFYVLAITTAFKRSYIEELVIDEFAPVYQAPVQDHHSDNEIQITPVNTDTVKIPITYITPELDEKTQENTNQES